MSRWNPRNLSENCGFCAVSYALEQQKGIFIDADQLYSKMMEKFGFERQGGESPVPRTLIFPDPNLSDMKWTDAYSAFRDTMYTPAQYTVRSVAEEVSLDLKPGDRAVVNALIKFAYDAAPGWRFDDFVRQRSQRPGVTAGFGAQKQYMEAQLKGNWVIGSKEAKHYVNMSFTPAGEWKVFDAQIGVAYDGKGMKAKMPSLDLFDRVSTGK
jgi:hypothetical protein